MSIQFRQPCLFRRSRASVALSLALVASLWTSQAAAQSRVPTHVACVGDSITYGYMASSASASYPSVLQNMFGSSVKVMNYGHNSATMLSVGDLPYQNQTEYTAATTFVSGAGASAVVDVIIMLGTNDSKSYNWMVGTGTRAQQFVTDYSAMVDHFTSLPTHPVVYLAFPPRAFANTYGISGTIIHDQILPLIQQVATAKGMPIIDVDTPTASLSNLFPDGVHPNDTGYALVAQVMHDGLLAAGGTGGTAGQGGRGGVTGQGGAGGAAGASGGGGRGGAGQAGSGGAAGTSATGGRGGAGQAGSGGAAGTSASGGRGGAGQAGSGGAAGTSASGGRGGAGQGGAQAGSGGEAGTLATGGRDGAGQAGSDGTAGTSGSGVGGTTGVSTGGSGVGGGSGGATEVDAGNASGSGGGCSCRLGGGRRSGGVGLLLAALVCLARRRRTR